MSFLRTQLYALGDKLIIINYLHIRAFRKTKHTEDDHIRSADNSPRRKQTPRAAHYSEENKSTADYPTQ